MEPPAVTPGTCPGNPVSDGERAARAELTWLAAPGDQALGAFVRAAGEEQAMTLIRAGRLPRDAGLAVPGDARRSVSRWHAALGKVPSRREVLDALEGRFRLLCPGDAEWPAGLDALGEAAPVALWVTGVLDLRFSCLRSVAVTGSRAATAYGSYLASELGAALASRGVTVISGASFGIDAAAHRGALAADGATIAVLPGGIDVPYPAAHADLLQAVAAQGALVSEAPPGIPAGRLRFEFRHRVIAALATGTVVVESAARGRALTAARFAHGLGRPVMAVPGPVTSDLSAGCHDLIRSGQALLVTCAGDVVGTLTEAGCPVG